MNGLDYLNNWKKTKVAVYVRVSTNTQVNKGHGLDGQISLCKKMCDIKNYTITEIYTDGGVSGTTKAHDRPGFNKLLIDAKNKKFKVLVFYSFDRLARDIRVFLNIVDEIKEYGIKIVSCKENVDTTTDTGEFMMNIYASVSHLELKTIKTRLAMGREEKRLKNGDIGGIMPYGYSRIDGSIEINEYKANTVNIIYTLYHDNKLGLREICRWLDDKNIKTPRNGKKWSKNTVTNILDNHLKYEGCVINNNENGIRWPLILNTRHTDRIKIK